MKSSTPIFIHNQHPMLVFFMPPGWLMIISATVLLSYIILNIYFPSVSMIVAGIGGILMFIVLKIKMGKDRHSDMVFRTGLSWRLKHASGRINAK